MARGRSAMVFPERGQGSAPSFAQTELCRSSGSQPWLCCWPHRAALIQMGGGCQCTRLMRGRCPVALSTTLCLRLPLRHAEGRNCCRTSQAEIRELTHACPLQTLILILFSFLCTCYREMPGPVASRGLQEWLDHRLVALQSTYMPHRPQLPASLKS